MSEPIPESIPTSADPRSRRPAKKARPNPSTNPLADDVSNLFADPEKKIVLPQTSAEIAARQAAIAASQVPEIVTNVQGSSAGAGSGEFHVYKASRRREYERVKKMEEEVEKETADAKWEAKQRERQEEDEVKRAKNKAKRNKKKEKKQHGKDGKPEVAASEKPKPEASGLRSGLNDTSTANGHEKAKEVDAAVTNPEEIGVVIHDDD